MKLSVIRHLLKFAEENDVDFLTESLDVLDHMIDARGMTEEEIDVIGEIMSNMLGAKEVLKDIESGTSERDALNKFMKKVTSVGKE